MHHCHIARFAGLVVLLAQADVFPKPVPGWLYHEGFTRSIVRGIATSQASFLFDLETSPNPCQLPQILSCLPIFSLLSTPVYQCRKARSKVISTHDLRTYTTIQYCESYSTIVIAHLVPNAGVGAAWVLPCQQPSQRPPGTRLL